METITPFEERLQVVFDSSTKRINFKVSVGRKMITLRCLEDQQRVIGVDPPCADIALDFIHRNIIPEFCSTITAKNNSIDWVVFLGTRYRHFNSGNEYYLALVPPNVPSDRVTLTYVLADSESCGYRYAFYTV